MQAHLAPDWARLLGHINDTKASFANLLQQFVTTNLCAWAFGQSTAGCLHNGGRFEKPGIVFLDVTSNPAAYAKYSSRASAESIFRAVLKITSSSAVPGITSAF